MLPYQLTIITPDKNRHMALIHYERVPVGVVPEEEFEAKEPARIVEFEVPENATKLQIIASASHLCHALATNMWMYVSSFDKGEHLRATANAALAGILSLYGIDVKTEGLPYVEVHVDVWNCHIDTAPFVEGTTVYTYYSMELDQWVPTDNPFDLWIDE